MLSWSLHLSRARVVYAQLKVTYIWAIDDRRPPTSTLYGTVKSTLWIFFCQNCFIRRSTVCCSFFCHPIDGGELAKATTLTSQRKRIMQTHTRFSHWFDFLFATFSCQFTTFSSIFSSLGLLTVAVGGRESSRPFIVGNKRSFVSKTNFSTFI